MGAEETKRVADTPVRLMCRYSNGIVKSYLARALSFESKGEGQGEGQVLRVLTNEQFEPGIPLTAMAAFLPSNMVGRVTAVTRSERPGYFVLELSLRLPPPAAPKPQPVPAPAAQTLQARQALTRFAAALAGRLEASGNVPLYNAAFECAMVNEKQGFLVSTAVAVFLLLAQKEQVDSAQVLGRLRKS